MSNWNAGHTPYHHTVPLPSPAPGTEHHLPPRAEQWPTLSARPPSILSLESQSSYGTAPSCLPSLPSVLGRAWTPPLADYFEDVYSPDVAASLGNGSQDFGSAASGYTSGLGPGYPRGSGSGGLFSPPPIPSDTSYRSLYHSSAQRYACDRTPASFYGSTTLIVQRPEYNFNPTPYHAIVPHAMLPMLPPLAPGSSDVTIYARCDGGSSPDVEVRTRGSETVVRIKHHHHHHGERKGHKRHRQRS